MTASLTAFLRHGRCRCAWAPWIIAVALMWPMAGKTGEETGDKRVETRGAEGNSTARPAGSRPGSEGPTQPDAEKECVVVKETTTEETHVIQTEVVVVLEKTPVPIESADLMAFEEVLLNTLGRRKVTTVVASTDARNPFPSYAYVGFQPPPIEQGIHHTVRLQRFECEFEAGADWAATHSVFTLAVGGVHLQFIADDSDFPSTLPVLDVVSGRIYPLTVAVSKRITAPGTDRYRLSVHFRDAALGHAPRILPAEGVYLSAGPSSLAPLGYSALKFILVEGTEGQESSLLLVEKSGSAVAILPNLNRLELAAFCSVVNLLPR
jgi:hypothetical protein